MKDAGSGCKSERTKKFIIESTFSLFNKKGYAGTSLSDLTRATGLTKGSIYGNFRNKDEVALCVFEYGIARITTAFAAAMAGEKTYLGKLLAYPRVYRAMGEEIIASGGCPLANILANDARGSLKKAAMDTLGNWKKTIRSLIEKGKNAGEIRAAVDPEQTAMSIITLIEGASVLAKGTGSRDYYLNGIDTVEGLIRSLTEKP